MRATVSHLLISAATLAPSVIAQTKPTVSAAIKQIPVRGHLVVEVSLVNNSTQRVVIPDLRRPDTKYFFHIFSGSGVEVRSGPRHLLLGSGSNSPTLIEANSTAAQLVTLDGLFEGLVAGAYQIQLFDSENLERVHSDRTSIEFLGISEVEAQTSNAE